MAKRRLFNVPCKYLGSPALMAYILRLAIEGFKALDGNVFGLRLTHDYMTSDNSFGDYTRSRGKRKASCSHPFIGKVLLRLLNVCIAICIHLSQNPSRAEML